MVINITLYETEIYLATEPSRYDNVKMTFFNHANDKYVNVYSNGSIYFIMKKISEVEEACEKLFNVPSWALFVISVNKID